MNSVTFDKDEYISIKVDGAVEVKSHKDSKTKRSICQVKCAVPSE